ncbi:methylenetetrahydrofolate--tRNA-(uracil(54)-C(5))-methyltransferase (FADH(2)-oxidizing) TrmFO [bacterium]|nr:methylenetetrahydrofolate--tRNA-(uracil(54)-C(5))-methyltransferase (FADH(2)-oxidizing) TrmFO [bacterium]
MSSELHIIGGGLAGTEAAWQAASLGIEVVLYEMRPTRKTEVHKTETLAELVCSNSFRSDDHQSNAVGVLHQEMRMMNSLIMQIADLHKVPAGGALAVDRELFASEVEHRIASHPNITLKREEITSLDNPDWENIIIATGPLTAEPLAEAIIAKTGEADLAFFDAIAPIVYFETINMDIAWFQSRYDKGDGKDYINCPMNKSQYEAFIEALNAGDKMMFKEWEENTPYFDGCMPIEIMASRGPETLRFGPMKPVGLTNAHDKSRPYAVVQLRQDNKLGSLFNIVGFQTKLKYAEQTRIFRMIPGLEEAEFARLGGLHRNTFINTPRLLDAQLRLRSYPKIRFAGQITGVEGYVESAAIGGMAGKMAAYETLAKQWHSPPEDTAHGALLTHLTSGAVSDSFQPMNVNFGLFPPLLNADSKSRKLRGRDRKAAYASRSLSSMEQFLEVQS